MKKADIIIIAAVLAIAALFVIFLNLPGSENDNLIAEVYINGELEYEYDLSKYAPDKTQTVTINTDEGYNTILLSSDGVKVAAADCGALDCVHMGKIIKSGGIIACLPHKLFIKLVGNYDEKREVDIVAG